MDILKRENGIWICIILFCASMFLFTRHLEVHGLEFRDDEVFYFESTQEMINTGDYLSPKYFGENRFQKPILYYWLIVLSYKLFGINWFSARLVASIFAGLTVCLTWKLARQLFEQRVALVSSVVLMTMPMFFRHARNAVPDMPLNFFIVLSIYFAVRFINSLSNNTLLVKEGLQKNIYSHKILSSLFFLSCSLGFMIKGLAAIIIPFVVLICFLVFTKKFNFLLKLGLIKGIFIMSCIILPWFIYMTKIHGHEYVDYIVGSETGMRVIGEEVKFGFLKWARLFVSHIGFYLKTIMSYFAPWSIFYLVLFPYIIFNKNNLGKESSSLLILFIWVFSTILVFSPMYFVINHYMLVISTPLAILTGWFLTRDIKKNSLMNIAVYYYIKIFMLIIVFFGAISLSVLHLLSSSGSSLLIIFYLLISFLGLIIIQRSKNPMSKVAVICIFMFIAYMHSNLFNEAGLTSHSKLQKFAEIINRDKTDNYIVSVGSHDIHEKELQVYFNQKVEKSGVSWDAGVIKRIKKLFSSQNNFYLLILDKDFNKYVKNVYKNQFHVIQEEYILKRRMHLDQGFIKALVTLDKKKVKWYMMEKIILLKRTENS